MNSHYLYRNFIAFNTALELFVAAVGIVDELGERFKAFTCAGITGKTWTRSKYLGQVVKVGDVALAIVFTKNALEEASSVAEGKKECSNATGVE